MSSLERPPAAVRMMTPPVKPCCFAELPDDAAQARALFARFDLAGDADVVDRRHEDQEAARHRDVRRQPRALGAERLLDHLDEDLLAFLQQVFDLGLGPVVVASGRGPIRGRGDSRGGARRSARTAVAAVHRRDRRLGDAGLGAPRSRARRRRTGVLVLVAGLEAVELLDRVDDLGDVQERVALEADVNEGGLHAGQHLRDPALVDVADHAALTLALDEDLDDLIVLEDGDTRVVVARGDDHLLVHWNSRKWWNPARAAQTRARWPGHPDTRPASTRRARRRTVIPDH